MTTNPQGCYATINGLKLYYELHGEVDGSGRPLVVLHGAFGWANAFRQLARNRQLIAVELQGHGHTALTDRPMTFEQLADDVAALIRHLKLERADLFGYSMGGVGSRPPASGGRGKSRHHRFRIPARQRTSSSRRRSNNSGTLRPISRRRP
jgi:Alpha/beta hydrolase family